MIKHLRRYITGSLQFYKVRKDITPVVFCIILFTSLLGIILPDEVVSNPAFNFTYNFFSIVVISLSSAVYLYANIKDFKGEEYNLDSIRELLRKQSGRIILGTLLVLAATVLGLLIIIIGAIIIYLMLIFVVSFIVDKEMNVMEAFNASSSTTKGRKVEIFVINLLFNLILVFPLSFAYIFALSSSSNGLVPLFILTFASAVINLMQQRLVAFMYVDLVYNKLYKE